MALICRVPGGEPGDPGLMTYDQVTTFFHEFGHLIHAVSSGRQQWIGLTRVAERVAAWEAWLNQATPAP